MVFLSFLQLKILSKFGPSFIPSFSRLFSLNGMCEGCKMSKLRSSACKLYACMTACVL